MSISTTSLAASVWECASSPHMRGMQPSTCNAAPFACDHLLQHGRHVDEVADWNAPHYFRAKLYANSQTTDCNMGSHAVTCPAACLRYTGASSEAFCAVGRCMREQHAAHLEHASHACSAAHKRVQTLQRCQQRLACLSAAALLRGLFMRIQRLRVEKPARLSLMRAALL